MTPEKALDECKMISGLSLELRKKIEDVAESYAVPCDRINLELALYNIALQAAAEALDKGAAIWKS